MKHHLILLFLVLFSFALFGQDQDTHPSPKPTYLALGMGKSVLGPGMILAIRNSGHYFHPDGYYYHDPVNTSFLIWASGEFYFTSQFPLGIGLRGMRSLTLTQYPRKRSWNEPVLIGWYPYSLKNREPDPILRLSSYSAGFFLKYRLIINERYYGGFYGGLERHWWTIKSGTSFSDIRKVTNTGIVFGLKIPVLERNLTLLQVSLEYRVIFPRIDPPGEKPLYLGHGLFGVNYGIKF